MPALIGAIKVECQRIDGCDWRLATLHIMDGPAGPRPEPLELARILSSAFSKFPAIESAFMELAKSMASEMFTAGADNCKFTIGPEVILPKTSRIEPESS